MKLLLCIVYYYGLTIPNLITGHKMETSICEYGIFMVYQRFFRSFKKWELSSELSNQQVLVSYPVIQPYWPLLENSFISSIYQHTQHNYSNYSYSMHSIATLNHYFNFVNKHSSTFKTVKKNYINTKM